MSDEKNWDHCFAFGDGWFISDESTRDAMMERHKARALDMVERLGKTKHIAGAKEVNYPPGYHKDRGIVCGSVGYIVYVPKDCFTAEEAKGLKQQQKEAGK